MAKKKDNDTTSHSNGYEPQGWQHVSIGQVCENPVSGYSPVAADRPAEADEVGVLKLSCIRDNRFSPDQNKTVVGDKPVDLKTPVKKNTLIVSRSNTHTRVGAVCYVNEDYPNLYLSDLMWCISAKDHGRIDLKWLSYLLSFAPYRARITARANGTSESMKKINKTGFLGIRIMCPSLKEQQKIAKLLSIWDMAIDRTRRLIAAKEDRRKALAQRLLLGRNRLPEFRRRTGRKQYRYFELPQDWPCPPIGEIATERCERNRNNAPATILSCSKHTGFIKSSQNFVKGVSGQDRSNYKIIRRGWFGYPSNHIEEGSIGLLSDFAKGIVSPIYTVFDCTAEVNPDYLHAVFKTEVFRHIFAITTNASVDRRGSLRWKAFSRIRVPLPHRKEQNAIAQVLITANTEIAQHRRMLEALEKQKRGLMQKLLSGRIRVKH